jgi:uncharacterized protein YlaI
LSTFGRPPILWRYNRITGLWIYGRTVTEENAKSWLAIWEQDEPEERFVISYHKPTKKPVDKRSDSKDTKDMKNTARKDWKCNECGKRMTLKAAEKASFGDKGCTGCGGSDIDLDSLTSTTERS